MTIVAYEVCFHVLSKYSYSSISTNFEKVLKFVKSLDIYLQLATSQLLYFRFFFKSYGSCKDDKSYSQGISGRCQESVVVLVSLEVKFLTIEILKVLVIIRVGQCRPPSRVQVVDLWVQQCKVAIQTQLYFLLLRRPIGHFMCAMRLAI